MKQHESTHVEYCIAVTHFTRLAAVRTSDGFIKTSERTYQLIRNNCEMIAVFPRSYQHVHYLLLPSFISFNHTYYSMVQHSMKSRQEFIMVTHF